MSRLFEADSSEDYLIDIEYYRPSESQTSELARRAVGLSLSSTVHGRGKKPDQESLVDKVKAAMPNRALNRERTISEAEDVITRFVEEAEDDRTPDRQMIQDRIALIIDSIKPTKSGKRANSPELNRRLRLLRLNLPPYFAVTTEA